MHLNNTVFNMNTYKKKLIADFINNSEIVQSWGITKISHSEDTISFMVFGFQYKGEIKILCTSKNYIIYLAGPIRIICYDTSSVIKNIDTIVEYSENYSSILKKWISVQLELIGT